MFDWRLRILLKKIGEELKRRCLGKHLIVLHNETDLIIQIYTKCFGIYRLVELFAKRMRPFIRSLIQQLLVGV